MQFHLNGYEPGDPEISNPDLRNTATGNTGSLAREVDVLIVGCGPAGLTLAAQLSAFPDITTCIIDQKSGPLLRGQADGIACRTMEMFEAFGFSERVLKESCWINETTFWKPDAALGSIVRSGRVQDTEDGLSEFPHVILNQARVHDFYLDLMRKSPAALEPHYARRLLDLDIDQTASDDDAYPVTARIERVDPAHEGQIETIRARYVVGCDGARSAVRKSIGRALHGDSANHAWGVMDLLATTDFPDIRFKSVIQSANDGTMLVIPREGGYLFRLYVEMDKLDVGERASNRNITSDDLIATAQRILTPYTLNVKEVAWWSVYEIGQRLCDGFDDVTDPDSTRLPRAFIAGDACHTHSPKAGQGMNVSMQDGFNLGWKLAAVLRKRAAPHLLQTYSRERQAIAKELIDFDREWASVISSGSKPHEDGNTDGAAQTQDYFVRHGRYTAGTAAQYRPALLTGKAIHQHLATGFVIGTRLHSAPVIRVADARPLQLGHTVKADGRWRLFAFAGDGDPAAPESGIHALCDFLENDATSPLKKYTGADEDSDAVFDIRAIFQNPHPDIDISTMPALLLPTKGRFGLTDYEKLFCPDLKSGHDIFAMRGIDRKNGCIVVVRPDQYIAHVLPLNGYAALTAFFDGFMVRPG